MDKLKGLAYACSVYNFVLECCCKPHRFSTAHKAKPEVSSPGRVLLLEQPLVRAVGVVTFWHGLVRIEVVQLQIPQFLHTSLVHY